MTYCFLLCLSKRDCGTSVQVDSCHNGVSGQNPPGQNPPDKIPRTKSPWTKSPLGQNPPRTKSPWTKSPQYILYFIDSNIFY